MAVSFRPEEPEVPIGQEPDEGEGFFESLEIGPIRGTGIALTGVGVAAGVVFVITGLSSQSKFDEVSESCDNSTCPETAEFTDAIDDGKSLETIANVSLIVSAVLIAAGVTMIAIGDEQSDESAVGRTKRPKEGLQSVRLLAVPLATGASTSDAEPRVSGGFVGVTGRF